MFAPSSPGRLTARDLARFAGGTLFDRIARAVCQAGCLPRKELFESWEMARRVRRLFRGGRVVDLGGGHGLLGQIMLILDDSSPEAIIVDCALPPSHEAIHAALARVWPRLSSRVTFEAASFDDVRLEASDVIVSSHACGALTDVVLDRVMAVRARVAVLPCCHDHRRCDAGDLSGWMRDDLAIDAVRAMRLQQHGYRIWTKTISADVTPRNRLLMGRPGNLEPGCGLER
jgi:hypothetical protein